MRSRSQAAHRHDFGLGRTARGLCLLIVGVLGGLLLAPAAGVGDSPRRPPVALPASPGQALVRDSTAHFDANEMGLGVSNLGSFVFPRAWAFGGLEWPRGSGRSVIFTAGLWVAALVGGDTLITVAEYSDEYAAGPLLPSGEPLDPAETDPAQRVYRIGRCDDARSNPDWASWPAAFGAPVDASGAPRLLGDQTLWCVYNDAVAAHHRNWMAGTRPLGIEVRQAVSGFARGGDLDRVVFLSFDILNRGPNRLDSAFVALWLDPDLGGAEDDLVGCDTTLDLGFAYNGRDSDAVYGVHPPAVGCALLQGPVVGGDTLHMTSFGRLLKDWNEPMNPGMAYRRMERGLPDPDRPALFPCDAPGTRFEVSGDPVAATGCRDTLPADRRMMLSSGPFTLAPGDSQRVMAALAVGGHPDEGDRLSNLALLRATVSEARALYRAGFSTALPAPDCGGPLRLVIARPNPAQGIQRFEFVVPAGTADVGVRVHDLAGRRVWAGTLAVLHAGVGTFEWDGRADDGSLLPAGVYFVRFEDGRGGSIAGRAVRLR